MATIPAPTRAPVRKVRFAAAAAVIVAAAGAVTDAAETVHLPSWVVALAAGVAVVGTAYLTAAGAEELPTQQTGVRDDGLVHGPGPDWLGE